MSRLLQTLNCEIKGCPPGNERKRLLVVRRILLSYGGERSLRRIVKMAEAGVAGSEIASKFGVSRQRVNQWLSSLGNRSVRYEVHSSIRKLMNGG